MAIAHKMENALARAEELLAVNQQSAALQLLYDAICSRHFQHNLLALEPIVIKFVQLCVALRQGRFVKDGLSQYRSFSQNTNMHSFESAIKLLVRLTEERLEEALKSASSTAALAADSSVVGEDPAVEEISKMLQHQLSLETGKERVDRETVLPWLRFMWEALRVSIEVCRNNVKLERLYTDLTFKAFDYCLKHQKKSELRRLAETLRYHLIGIIKGGSSAHSQPSSSITLIGEAANPESQQLQLDIRYRQLDVALEMELWQEAFRSIEDIHGLFLLGGKSADALITREEYFEKVARIFAMSENTLFYSAALLGRFHAFSNAGDSGDKDQVKRSAALSLLAVPLGSAGVCESVFNSSNWSFLEDQHDRASRLARFLGLSAPPTHHSLLHDILQLGVADEKITSLLQVYCSLDFSKCSIDYVAAMNGHIQDLLRGESKRFLDPIQSNLLYMHLKHLEASRASVRMDALRSSLSQAMARPVDVFMLLQKWTRSGDLTVSIDMANANMCSFNQPSVSLVNNDSPSMGFDYEDPKVAFMHQLCLLLISRHHHRQQQQQQGERPPCQALNERLEASKREFVRKQDAVARQKEEREVARREREKEEMKERMARLAAEQEAEVKRLEEEAAARERERIAREREILRKEEQKKKEEEEKRVAELSGVRANLERLQQLSVRLDHIERALRSEELPLLEADYQRQLIADQQAYGRRVEALRDESRCKFESDRLMRSQISAFAPDISGFVAQIRERKLAEHNTRQKELDAELAALRAQRIAEKASERERMISGNMAAMLQQQHHVPSGTDERHDTASSPAVGAKKYAPPHMQQHSISASSSWRKDGSPSAGAIAEGPESQTKPGLLIQDEGTQPSKTKYVPPHLKNKQ